MSKRKKYIFVIGGVMSSVGKGITTASTAKLLQSKGYRVTCVKADPYINVDAGTMNPTEHGETFVTKDSDECDQDMGNYERFLDQELTRDNYMTTGRVYQAVIQKERNLEYHGRCVEVVPDIPNEIIRRIKQAGKKNNADIVLIEVGGTVGEYQNILFLEAARMLKQQNPGDVVLILVSYLPIPSKVGEMKTKPTQYAARTLNNAGLQADFIIARGERAMDQKRREKLAIFCGIDSDAAISAPDVDSIYEVPLLFNQEKLADKILAKLNLKNQPAKLSNWIKLVNTIKSNNSRLKIAVVGKYFNTGEFILADSYISVIEAIKHAGWFQHVQPELTWIDAEKYEKQPRLIKELAKFDGVIVPGGFGTRGIEGIIKAIHFSREQGIPYFGLCYGMELAAIEIARYCCGLSDAHTVEVNPQTVNPIIHINQRQLRNFKTKQMGGTLRLGNHPCDIIKGSIAYRAYGQARILERHRHRYEFNNDYLEPLKKAGVLFSGINPVQNLVEIIEYPRHPWFVGVQFHPEFKSTPLHPHPLYLSFIRAAMKRRIKRR